MANRLEQLRRKHDYIPAFGTDRLLPYYDVVTRLLGARRVHRRLVELARTPAGAQVLDIGCGTGNLTILARRAQPDAVFTGSDPDPLALARATRKAEGLGIRFERGYAQRLPYPDESFDLVFSALMLHHLDDEARRGAMREVRRVLRPGGLLYLADIRGPEAELFTGAGFSEHARLDGLRAVFGAVEFHRARA